MNSDIDMQQYPNHKLYFRYIGFLTVSLLLMACTNRNQPFKPKQKMELNSGWMAASDTLASFPAQVPGTIHTDLLRAGYIQEPFRYNHENALQWVEEHNWWYTTSFEITGDQQNYTAAEMVFEGLDTEAEVWLNDSLILRANNMFREWRIPVKPLLTEGINKLRIVFESPVRKHKPNAESAGIVYPADSDKSKTSPFTRKAAYHFGWDWAPRFVTCGIWKPAYLEFHDQARIASVHIEQAELSEHKARLRAHVEVISFTKDPDVSIEVYGKKAMLTGADSLYKVTVDFEIDNPEIWWPNGSGSQHLYSIPVRLLKGDYELDAVHETIGLRKIELVNKPDSTGTSFYFRINGKPLFIQGANYVPQDVFLTRVKPGQYRRLLIAAKEANMNMLRVWGGGVYEQNLFYHLCDSLGLLVWQDFMFAGTMYPGDQAFVENVKAEVRGQIRRLRNHPCLAIWCGNNEIEVAWKNWGWQDKYNYSAQDSSKMWSDYLHLFHDVIPGIVAEESADIPYVSTSPQSNWGTAENFNHGSMHYWGVWHGREPIGAFKENIGRFMVEYGLQSYPEMQTLEEYISHDELNLNSEALNYRQKSYIGNGEILRHILDLNLPEPENLNQFILASQQAQAIALRTAIRAHKDSNGHCMGTLLWQLNDCWPGPSWSIIDYLGRKKPAYEQVKLEYSR